MRMKIFGLLISYIAAIDIGNIRLPSPHTAYIQQDFLFDDRHALKFADNYLYIQTLKAFLDKFTDVEVFKQYKLQAENELIHSNRDITTPKFRKNSKNNFRNLMIQKCGISDEQFKTLHKYVSRNNLEKSCLYQLKRWNQDLIHGNFFAQVGSIIHNLKLIFGKFLFCNFN